MLLRNLGNTSIDERNNAMNVKVTPFLMFEGKAEEAMNLYTSLIPNSSILQITRHGPEGPGREGSVMTAMFTLRATRVQLDAVKLL